MISWYLSCESPPNGSRNTVWGEEPVAPLEDIAAFFLEVDVGVCEMVKAEIIERLRVLRRTRIPMTEQDKRAALNKYAADLAQYNQDIYMRTHGPVAEEHYGAWKAYEAVVAFEVPR